MPPIAERYAFATGQASIAWRLGATAKSLMGQRLPIAGASAWSGVRRKAGPAAWRLDRRRCAVSGRTRWSDADRGRGSFWAIMHLMDHIAIG